MDKYEETFQTWDKVSKAYEEKFMNLELYNDTYTYFCASIPKNNAAILELGCGPGNITRFLLSKRPDFQLLGIDVAQSMVDLATENNPSANFAVMDARNIQQINARFDGIVCGFCLPYLSVDDRYTLIKNCRELLNSSGMLYLSFVAGDPSLSHFQANSRGRVYFYYHNVEELIEELNKHDFKIVKTFELAYHKTASESETHTIIIAQKQQTTHLCETDKPS